jgi:transcriptional regulator with XRE-family HTH domain
MENGLPARLRKLRKNRRLTQRDLAKLSGVHHNTISGIESRSHKPHPSTLRLLAVALGADVEYLTEGAPRPEMADFIRSLHLEPEPYFTNVEISTEEVRSLYEAAYVRVLRAEKERSVELLMDRRSLDLVEAVKKLPPSDEKAQLQERVKALLEREVAAFREEAERRARELREAGQELIGAA